MATIYICDNDECERQMTEPQITVEGVSRNGEILLPAQMLVHHFCSRECMLKAYGLREDDV
jgi:hypothetical protein